MKHIHSTCLTHKSISDMKTLRPLVLGLALLDTNSPVYALTTYTLTDLNTVTSDAVNPVTGASVTGIQANAINANGMVVGVLPMGSASAMRFYNSVTGNLSEITLGVTGSNPTDINANGQVIYQSGTGSRNLPSTYGNVLNPDGTSVNIGLNMNATSINDSGQVAGFSYDLITKCSAQGFVWSALNGVQRLGSLAGVGGWSEAKGVNSAGQVVGSSYPQITCPYNYSSQISHAFVSTSTGLKDLHAATMPYDSSAAYGINANGLAVGDFHFSNSVAVGWQQSSLSAAFYPSGFPITHAVVWNTATGAYTDLGTGDKYSTLTAINASGQVVGHEGTYSTAAFNTVPPDSVTKYAVIGNASGGVLTDLNTLVVGMPAGWALASAYDINDAGQILVDLTDTATGYWRHRGLLTPSTLVVNLPAVPTNLISATASSTQINLSWEDNASNETAQYLERCQGVGCTNFAQIASLAANITSFNNTTLTSATSYSYRIRAHGTTGNSAYSNTVTASTLAPLTNVLPAAPSNLASSAKSSSQIVLTWADNATNEQNFLLERCKGLSCVNFSQVAKVGANVKTYSNTGLVRNTSYGYRVRASNLTGKSAYSNIVSVKTLP
jgi:hypothetical protein